MISDEVWSRLEQDIQPLRTVQKVTAQNAAMTGNQGGWDLWSAFPRDLNLHSLEGACGGNLPSLLANLTTSGRN